MSIWLKGLIAAFIGGGANLITQLISDPASFDTGQWKKVLSMALVGAVLAVAAYLKASPLPPGDTDRQ